MTAQPWPDADASVLAPVPEHEDLRTVMRDLLQTHAPHDQVRRAAELPEGYSPKLWSLLNDEMDVGSLAVPGGPGRARLRRGRAGRRPRGGRVAPCSPSRC